MSAVAVALEFSNATQGQPSTSALTPQRKTTRGSGRCQLLSAHIAHVQHPSRT
jgi:hypothetical protein